MLISIIGSLRVKHTFTNINGYLCNYMTYYYVCLGCWVKTSYFKHRSQRSQITVLYISTGHFIPDPSCAADRRVNPEVRITQWNRICGEFELLPDQYTFSAVPPAFRNKYTWYTSCPQRPNNNVQVLQVENHLCQLDMINVRRFKNIKSSGQYLVWHPLH